MDESPNDCRANASSLCTASYIDLNMSMKRTPPKKRGFHHLYDALSCFSTDAIVLKCARRLEMMFTISSTSFLLQPVWDTVLKYESHLASPLFAFLWGSSLYVLFCLPYVVFDLAGPRWPRIHHYKIQSSVPVAWANVKKAAFYTLRNYVCFVLPIVAVQMLLSKPIPLPKSAPSVAEMAIHLIICLVAFDTEYFLWHLAHHRVRFLYKHVHALHHEIRSPFVFATQYVHPFELFCTSLFSMSTPLLLSVHPLTNWIWMACSVFISVEDHCGYDFPLSLTWLLPFGIYGGAPHHDMHHERPTTNFQPFFTWWDRLLGTVTPSVRTPEKRGKNL